MGKAGKEFNTRSKSAQPRLSKTKSRLSTMLYCTSVLIFPTNAPEADIISISGLLMSTAEVGLNVYSSGLSYCLFLYWLKPNCVLNKPPELGLSEISSKLSTSEKGKAPN